MDNLRERGAGLTYRDAMPLRLRSAGAADDGAAADRLAVRNELLLRVSIALQDHHDVEERDEYSAELARLDLKMDLIIACLQPLLAANNALPEPVPVTLTPQGVSWPAADGPLLPDASPDEGPQAVVADIFINPVVPIPLSLRGTLKCDTRGAPPEAIGEVVFDPPGEQQTELLEKLIFRFHRHAVATGTRA